MSSTVHVLQVHTMCVYAMHFICTRYMNTHSSYFLQSITYFAICLRTRASGPFAGCWGPVDLWTAFCWVIWGFSDEEQATVSLPWQPSACITTEQAVEQVTWHINWTWNVGKFGQILHSTALPLTIYMYRNELCRICTVVEYTITLWLFLLEGPRTCTSDGIATKEPSCFLQRR